MNIVCCIVLVLVTLTNGCDFFVIDFPQLFFSRGAFPKSPRYVVNIFM